LLGQEEQEQDEDERGDEKPPAPSGFPARHEGILRQATLRRHSFSDLVLVVRAVITRAGLLTALAIAVLIAVCWVLIGD